LHTENREFLYSWSNATTGTVISSRWTVIEEVSLAYVIVPIFSYMLSHYRRNSGTSDEGWHNV